MRVVFHDPAVAGGVPLDELLRTSDIVSLHAPLTDATRGLLDRDRIARMRPGAILVNTARGALVDESALVEALESGRLGGAGLDVFEREPPGADSRLLSMPQVVLTPHSATGTAESLREKAQFYGANIARVLRGEEPLGRVYPART
jgi:phosphoglycerate dehydrogenase-like enzyme